MSLKHIIKYMAVPLVAAFALVGCKHEDFTTAPKSSAEQTETTTKKRTIKLRLSADIELPKGTGERGIDFSLDPTSDRYRPRIKWDAIKDKLRTRLYFRKMVKGSDGQMTPSQDRHDIFSVVIEPDKWTVKTVSNGHLKLSTEIVDPKSAKQQVMEIKVPDGTAIDETHPFIPNTSMEFPKNTPQEATPGTIVPESNGEWQVAAILSVSLNGDFGRDEKSVSRKMEATGAYFPQQYLLSDSKLNTQSAYEEHKTDFADTDPEVLPFKYDGYWLLYPKTMYFDHNNPNPQKPDDPNKEDPRQSMEIPFCADWKNVEIDERGVVGIELRAKSPGMILHYELIPDDVDALPAPKPIASPRGLSLASRGAKQSFRSGALSGNVVGANPNALDNLKSTACTFYGALYYDQDGDKVHWSRGGIDLTEYDNGINEYYFMKENTLSIYVRGANVSKEDLDKNSHCHMLYFVMPPYDKHPASADATTTFWLQPRLVKTEDDYSSEEEFSEAQPSEYKYDDLSYQLKKKGGTFENQYVSRTKLSPGKIHWVRLQYKKLDTPISFDPDAKP